MKYRRPQLFPIFVALAVAVIIAACTAEDAENPQIAAEKTQLYENIEGTIDSVDRRLAALEAQAEADTLPPEVEQEVERLRQMEAALASRLEELRETGEEQWQDFRADAERLMRETRAVLSPDTVSDTIGVDTLLP